MASLKKLIRPTYSFFLILVLIYFTLISVNIVQNQYNVVLEKENRELNKN